MSKRKRYDVVIIGGGHSGLTVAALLAKRGYKVQVLERRELTGGATVTEQPWGPNYKVTSLSYTFGMAPDYIVHDELKLGDHGLVVKPQYNYFAPYADGRYLQMHDDPKKRHTEISQFSVSDADVYEKYWDPMISQLASVMGPILHAGMPRVGSRSIGDLMDQAKFGLRLTKLGVDGFGDFTRFMSMSISDLLDRYFESPQLKAMLSASGLIGTWGGPRTPGTAFVMAHHKLGSGWGFPVGGMGAFSDSIKRCAESFGATVRVNADVERILVKDGTAVGVVLVGGEEIYAKNVVSTTHPKITFLEHLQPNELPESFLTNIRNWKSRGGTVKINLAVDRLPEFTCKPGFDPHVHGGTIVFGDSVDELEHAFQEAAVSRCASQNPFIDLSIQTVADWTLAPKGHHLISMFTQWVPHEWSKKPFTSELDAYADRAIARVERVAPGFTKSILHRQVIGPHQMQEVYGLYGGNIFAGELSVDQLGHMRPAPGYANHQTPIRKLYNASAASHGGGGAIMMPAWKVAQLIHGRKI